jgi:hypothetical protein
MHVLYYYMHGKCKGLFFLFDQSIFPASSLEKEVQYLLYHGRTLAHRVIT